MGNGYAGDANDDITVPVCTSTENAGAGNDWAVEYYFNNGFTGNVLSYTYNSTEAANAWFYTQAMSLEAGDYEISYEYANRNDQNNPEKMRVAIGTDANAGAMTTEITGKVYSGFFYHLSGGSNNISLDMSALAKGTYIVKASAANTVSTQKVIKQ
ncbi:hypothetical protein CW751_00375 [Brumimicrobium salinarum]|uniref:Secretion system C-terminal sorting domain-containing protein n=1 Tax=Brumimicrobium salinarum TaxID=2058658 RepID=A0A2I0R641_9FLAO|nr:T9SS type A sorting domain-containing protein [Brumimicrobium salinarum]PKR81830.1 hypothetical protein CW751_00375 [Brumimicrobium salinarum]